MLKKLPIGLSSLKEVIEGGFLYIDKTPMVAKLAMQKYFFLSRPRRFGKTLFLDTLKQAFLGYKDLFKGLYLENNWDWSQDYPVIHISFSGDDFGVAGVLDTRINSELLDTAKLYGVELEKTTNGLRLGELISKLKQKTRKPVVVLVDEYDKGILDAIDNPEIAVKNRELLKGFYGIIKEHDANLRFVFVTGVTKFAKAGIFSQLNNLQDITYDANYADICGYTQANIEHEFMPYLDGVNLTKLKHWYNGYNFLGTDEQKVYNPFDILLFISNNKVYKNYWFETGTPIFLIKLLQKNKYYVPALENLTIPEDYLSFFDVEHLTVEILLLQAGYLTIAKVETRMNELRYYTLNYPNFEVKQSLNISILQGLFGSDTPLSVSNNFNLMFELLNKNNIAELESVFRSIFAGISNAWYNNNNIC